MSYPILFTEITFYPERSPDPSYPLPACSSYAWDYGCGAWVSYVCDYGSGHA